VLEWWFGVEQDGLDDAGDVEHDGVAESDEADLIWWHQGQ